MKIRRCFLLSVVLLSLTGSSLALAGSDATPGEVAGDPVYIDSTEIVYLESFPVQVQLLVAGSLPTPCHELAWDVEELEDRIDVRLWSEAEPGRLCAAVLEPFEATMGLGSFASADLAVVLNSTEVGRIEIGVQPEPGTELTGAGWSFGMCLGYCRADFKIEGRQLVLTVSDQMSDEPLFANAGTLTILAQDRLDAALEHISVGELEPVYGCPDCADGGVAYLTFSHDGQDSRHEMELASPPPELAELHDLAMALIAALETCQSSDLVDVAGDCQAPER